MKILRIGVTAVLCSWMLMVLVNKIAGPTRPSLFVLAQSGQKYGSGIKAQGGDIFAYRFRAWLNEPLKWEEIKIQKFGQPFIDKLNKWLDVPMQWPEIKKPNPDAYDADYIERFRTWWMEARVWDELKTKKFDERFIERFKNWWNLPQTWLEPLVSKLS